MPVYHTGAPQERTVLTQAEYSWRSWMADIPRSVLARRRRAASVERPLERMRSMCGVKDRAGSHQMPSQRKGLVGLMMVSGAILTPAVSQLW